MRTLILSVCFLAAPLLCADTGEAYVEPAISATPAIAAETPSRIPARDPLWKVSLVTLAAANAIDVHSSWGKREMNQTLAGSRGTFGVQGTAIKLGMVGALAGLQHIILRGRPNRTLDRIFAIINFTSASVTSVTAARNYGIPRPPR